MTYGEDYRFFGEQASGGPLCFGLLLCLLGAGIVAPISVAQVPPPLDPLSFSGPDPAITYKDISIEQRLDAQVDPQLPFVDEEGNKIVLGDYFWDGPIVLALVYYECPMLCNLVLNGVEAAVDAMKYEVGEQYTVLTVSIDPEEGYELAAAKKAGHLDHMHRKGAAAGWHFLTGNSQAIDALAEKVGFRYVYDPKSDQFAHAAGIMVLTPGGKVARYYYGTEYIPRDLNFGLLEASEGKIGSLVDQLTLLCFHYDPTTGQYGFYVIGAIRIGAILMVLGLATFWLTHYIQSRRKRPKGPKVSADGAEGPDPPAHAGTAG